MFDNARSFWNILLLLLLLRAVVMGWMIMLLLLLLFVLLSRPEHPEKDQREPAREAVEGLILLGI